MRKLEVMMPFKMLLFTDTSLPLYTLVNVILDADATIFMGASAAAKSYVAKLP